MAALDGFLAGSAAQNGPPPRRWPRGKARESMIPCELVADNQGATSVVLASSNIAFTMRCKLWMHICWGLVREACDAAADDPTSHQLIRLRIVVVADAREDSLDVRDVRRPKTRELPAIQRRKQGRGGEGVQAAPQKIA